MEIEHTTTQAAEHSVKEIIKLFDDSAREGLQQTPARYIKFMREFMQESEFNLTQFDGEKYDEMILQDNIHFFSLCEHHLLPFFGTVTVAYIPNGKIIGLSKIARTVDKFARRFQNQERMTQQIAEYLFEKLEAKGVAVLTRARHLCMEMRGVKQHDCYTTTSKLLGNFKEDASTRSEFLNLVK